MRLLLFAMCWVATMRAADRPELTIPMTQASAAWPAESAWETAARIPALSPPLNAAPEGEEQTTVRLLWTRDHLFVRFTCREGTPVNLDATPTAERPLHVADCVEIFLDPVGDGRVFAELQFDSQGRSFDALHVYSAEPVANEDFTIHEDVIRRESWFFPEWTLPGMRVEARAIAPGWEVTVALPASPLLKRLGRTTFETGEELRANFLRLDYSAASGKPRITNWAPVVFGRAHRSPAGMGRLVLAGPGNP
ncbi:carbohydrate family 9 binding domain-like [Terrimicrobium sacchariphilum]|uniref:Carbohydrate family 9 binding domain-like n=1 Tax=Terrimicrobium sacchariphilum TaxID=690879 RepID=A0A146G559_TERSA|nr:carbohydrate-binding family 9-like protein [Terrimicrobium sacchariphilum]GAT32553.1 carbohydrate family 9 binding domain-like [Terrimicrobium sacchariphilum]